MGREANPSTTQMTMAAITPADSFLGPLVEGVGVTEASRQDVSFVMRTNLMSAVPPLRPSESIMVKMMGVPAATLAVQLYEGPSGGWRTNDCPPGTAPYRW